jgi:hypothetical protein
MHAREVDRPEPRVALLTDLGGFRIEISVWTGAPHGDAILGRITADIAARQPETEGILFRLREVTTVGESGELDDSRLCGPERCRCSSRCSRPRSTRTTRSSTRHLLRPGLTSTLVRRSGSAPSPR